MMIFSKIYSIQHYSTCHLDYQIVVGKTMETVKQQLIGDLLGCDLTAGDSIHRFGGLVLWCPMSRNMSSTL